LINNKKFNVTNYKITKINGKFYKLNNRIALIVIAFNTKLIIIQVDRL